MSALASNESTEGTSTPTVVRESLLYSPTVTPLLRVTKSLYIHSVHFSQRDFLIDPASFPNVQPNDFFEIYDPALPKEDQERLTIQWTGPDNNALLQAPAQVSLTYSVARDFGLSPRQDVIVQRVENAL